MSKDILTKQHAAALLGIDRKTLRRWLRKHTTSGENAPLTLGHLHQLAAAHGRKIQAQDAPKKQQEPPPKPASGVLVSSPDYVALLARVEALESAFGEAVQLLQEQISTQKRALLSAGIQLSRPDLPVVKPAGTPPQSEAIDKEEAALLREVERLVREYEQG